MIIPRCKATFSWSGSLQCNCFVTNEFRPKGSNLSRAYQLCCLFVKSSLRFFIFHGARAFRCEINWINLTQPQGSRKGFLYKFSSFLLLRGKTQKKVKWSQYRYKYVWVSSKTRVPKLTELPLVFAFVFVFVIVFVTIFVFCEKTRVQDLTELPLGADFHSLALTFFNLFSLLHRLIQIQWHKTIFMIESFKMSTACKRSWLKHLQLWKPTRWYITQGKPNTTSIYMLPLQHATHNNGSPNPPWLWEWRWWCWTVLAAAKSAAAGGMESTKLSQMWRFLDRINQ